MKELISPEVKDALIVIMSGVFALLGKWGLNAVRKKEGATSSGRKPCIYGDANHERIIYLETEIRVISSQIDEIQRQVDELYDRQRTIEDKHIDRLREVEEKIHLILGHIRENI